MMDNMLKPMGKSLIGDPEVVDIIKQQMTGSGNSPVLARAPLLLSESLLFPYREGLSFEQDVFPALTSRGASLKVQVVNAPFLDIGTPETLPQAESFIRQNLEQFV